MTSSGLPGELIAYLLHKTDAIHLRIPGRIQRLGHHRVFAIRTGGDAQLRLMAACLAHLFDQPVLEFLQRNRAGIPEHLAAGVHPQRDRCRRFGPVKALAGCVVAEQLRLTAHDGDDEDEDEDDQQHSTVA
ncbi:hypothetical protein FHY16_000112 [Xanthomonas campestris]|uniref:hypothetical protein n=1 Tax=Xanthomonas euroxanthea TaxID=2259622 RepID=UPI00161420AE|nr:hypothetical protein [Xanthomonas euroxanthea]